MDNSVLRGFCQKCESPCVFGNDPMKNVSGLLKCGHSNGKALCEPVWFLSPQQMKKIYFSQEFANWRYMHQQKEIWDFLIHSPFLVTKILKEKEVE